MLTVLIAEDDLMIAGMTETILVDAGYQVFGIGRSVRETVGLALCHKPDLAIIDLRLADGESGTEIAPQLTGIGRLGVLYASGNVSPHSLASAIGDACLVKPFGPNDLLRSLKIVSEIVATGSTQQPFPRGFKLLRKGCLFQENPS